jgi:NAD(P)-dependent dehydrogenase (short-subunit alcohol dehydrogenase family)
MDTGLKGKTVLVTGASRNMGRLCALMFAREGANLAICTSTRVDDLNRVAEECRALGVGALAEQCDITDPGAVNRFVQHAHDKFKSVDVVISLAGYRCEGNLLDIDFETFNRTIAVNLAGPFHLARAVIPGMKDRRWGRIINIAGISPYLGSDAPKAMVKLGIVGFTRGLAREFGPYNITANCMGPGVIERPREPGVREKPLRSTQPIPRKGTPEEALSVVVYLASEQASFVTGQCYLVNGGVYMQ